MSARASSGSRSEEHTSELQSRQYLVCRLLLEKKKKKKHDLITQRNKRILKKILYMKFKCFLETYHIIFFFFNDTATTEIYTLSLHDALPTSARASSGS